LGDLHTARIAMEQQFADRFFQFLDGARDGLRRSTEACGRFLEAAGFRGSAEQAKHFQTIEHGFLVTWRGSAWLPIDGNQTVAAFQILEFSNLNIFIYREFAVTQ